jgi:hypothetical protein
LFERLYGRGIFKNHEYRKEAVEKWVAGSTYYYSSYIVLRVEDYWLDERIMYRV